MPEQVASAPSEVLTPDQVATRLDISRATVMRYSQEGTLRVYMRTRHSPRFLWAWVVEDLRTADK